MKTKLGIQKDLLNVTTPLSLSTQKVQMLNTEGIVDPRNWVFNNNQF